MALSYVRWASGSQPASADNVLVGRDSLLADLQVSSFVRRRLVIGQSLHRSAHEPFASCQLGHQCSIRQTPVGGQTVIAACVNSEYPIAVRVMIRHYSASTPAFIIVQTDERSRPSFDPFGRSGSLRECRIKLACIASFVGDIHSTFPAAAGGLSIR